MSGDANEPAKQAAAPAKIAPSTSDAHAAKPASHVPPSPATADKIVASKTAMFDPGVAGSATIDLGDQLVGSQTTHDTIVWNLETTDAAVSASVEGSPSIQLVSVPRQIRPSRDGVDPENKFQVLFSPTARGRVHGTLRVSVSWPSGEHAPVELVAPIDGGAHADGAMTLADEAVEEHKRETEQKAAADQVAAEKRDKTNEDRRWKEQRVHGSEFARRELDQATAEAQRSLQSLYMNRHEGVTTLEREAGLYHKRQIPHEESLLMSLAMAGLDVATAGIAGYIGKSLEGPLKSILGSAVAAHTAIDGAIIANAEIPAAAEVVAFFTDGVKQGVKSLGKAVQPGHDSAHQPGGDTMFSPTPLFDFAARESVALTKKDSVDAEGIAKRARDALEPLLDSAPRQAVEAMKQVTRTLDETNGDELAAKEQAQASALHWIEYVAQARIGSWSASEARAAGKLAPAGDATLTQIDGVTAPPTTRGAPPAVTGIVDVEFGASATHAQIPASIRRVYVQGISNNVAHRLAKQSLLESKLAVRAHGVSSDGDAVLPVTVVRDEAGNLAYTDSTRGAGMPGPGWLVRKAGATRETQDAELRGARMLMEDDLMNQPVAASVIATDSDDRI